ncbi:hypothetical protein D3C77_269810 [compost metagenome]
MHRAQIDAHLKLTEMAQRPRRRLEIQGETFDAQRPRRVGVTLQQVEVVTAQAHPGDIGKIHQTAQLHADLLLVQIPEAAFKAGEVTNPDQRHARLDIAHFPAVLEIQLHGAGQHREAQTEQQNEQQQAAQQAISVQADHRASAGRLIMSR